MPGNEDLSVMGSGTNSVSEFLREIQKMQEDQISFENTLQRLKMTNVQNLGTMHKQMQQKLLSASIKDQQDVVKAEFTKRHEQWTKENAQRLLDNKNLTEKQFRDQYGKSKKQAEAEFARRKKQLAEEEKLRLKTIEKEAKETLKNKKKEIQTAKNESQKADREMLFGKGQSFGTRLKGLTRIGTADAYDKDGNYLGRKFSGQALFNNLANALSDIAKQLDQKIDTIAGYKSAVDTRLQGSKHSKNWSGSYWEDISSTITGAAGISPLIRQSDVAERVKSLVGQGIAFNVEQRAMLDVLKDKIATTFDAANGTLLRLVRIQQADTTAARLGMESALTEFLNNMYETTEYMQGIATTIKGSLNEAMSLMTGENALSFEYQVQKWLGSLYSVGMSDTAVQGLGGVLGKLGAGQLEALTSGGQGNLVIMAANQAGLSITDILHNGLTAETTNELLQAVVKYLAKIYNETGNSKVLQQQMASVFGVTAADLKAAMNLASSTGAVARNGLTYNSALNRLYSMADTMYSRTSIGEMMTNAWDNAQYSMAAGIANNPALYAMYKAASLLDTVAGGLEFSIPLVMGSGSAQTFNVANIMRAAALSGGILGSIGQMIASGGNGGLTGSGILNGVGINKGRVTTVVRGNGLGLSTTNGISVSSSGGWSGNESGDDVAQSTMTSQTDSSKASTASAVDSSEETKLKDVRNDIVDIYKLLQRMADDLTAGSYSIKTTVLGGDINVSNIDQINMPH